MGTYFQNARAGVFVWGASGYTMDIRVDHTVRLKRMQSLVEKEIVGLGVDVGRLMFW